MPFDFSKLSTKPKTQAERDAEAIAYLAKQRETHTAKCRDKAKTAMRIAGFYADEIETRYTEFRDVIYTIRGTDAANRPVRAEFHVPAAYGGEVQDAAYDHIAASAVLNLQGYWRPYTNPQGKKFFTFIALIADDFDLGAAYVASSDANKAA